MRIALLTYSTRPRGGVVHTLALAEALAAKGARVTVMALGRQGDTGFYRSVDPAVEVVVVPFADRADETLGPRTVRSIEVLAAAVNPERWDVVHAQDCISANAAPGAIRTVHHLDHFTTPELARCHERAIREPVAHVCVSVAVADELEAGWGITARVIPNGVDAPRFAAAAADDAKARGARAAWRDLLGPRWVLSVGGIEPRKGTIDLIEALFVVQHRHPGLPLVIAGGETLFDYRDYRAAFDRRCQELDIAPVVLGVVDNDQLPALVAASAVFAFPSIKEGFGLAALEAAAAGVPLVVRDLPVLREVFGDVARFGDSPATLAESIVEALDHPDPDRIERGRARAGALTWSAAAEAHLAFYAEVLALRP